MCVCVIESEYLCLDAGWLCKPELTVVAVTSTDGFLVFYCNVGNDWAPPYSETHLSDSPSLSLCVGGRGVNKSWHCCHFSFSPDLDQVMSASWHAILCAYQNITHPELSQGRILIYSAVIYYGNVHHISKLTFKNASEFQLMTQTVNHFWDLHLQY